MDLYSRQAFDLLSAVGSGQTELVRHLIYDETPAVDLSECVKANTTLADDVFWLAVRRGHVDIVRLLLTDASRFEPSSHENLALVFACQTGNVEMVRLLLADARVDPSASNNRAIRVARSNVEVVRLLLADERVDPGDGDNDAIREASIHGHVAIVRLLLADARVDPSNRAIRRAYANGHAEIVRLLAHAVDPVSIGSPGGELESGRSQYDGATRLLYASRIGDLDEVERLVHSQPPIDLAANDNAAFRTAAIHGHVHIVRLFLDIPNHNIDPAARNNEAIVLASRYGFTNMVRLLLRTQNRGIDPSARRNIAIYQAHQNLYVDVVLLLLDDPRVRTNNNDELARKRWMSPDGTFAIINLRAERLRYRSSSFDVEPMYPLVRDAILRIDSDRMMELFRAVIENANILERDDIFQESDDWVLYAIHEMIRFRRTSMLRRLASAYAVVQYLRSIVIKPDHQRFPALNRDWLLALTHQFDREIMFMLFEIGSRLNTIVPPDTVLQAMIAIERLGLPLVEHIVGNRISHYYGGSGMIEALLDHDVVDFSESYRVVQAAQADASVTFSHETAMMRLLPQAAEAMREYSLTDESYENYDMIVEVIAGRGEQAAQRMETDAIAAQRQRREQFQHLIRMPPQLPYSGTQVSVAPRPLTASQCTNEQDPITAERFTNESDIVSFTYAPPTFQCVERESLLCALNVAPAHASIHQNVPYELYTLPLPSIAFVTRESRDALLSIPPGSRRRYRLDRMTNLPAHLQRFNVYAPQLI